eukprot:8591390-Pyramimonas_sp.AAC.1
MPHVLAQPPSGRAARQLVQRDALQLNHVELVGVQNLLGEIRPRGAARAGLLLAEEGHLNGERARHVDDAHLE